MDALRKGFTLVELLIVAIMLAILAAIVVPQFATTTTDAQESALQSDLSALRAAVDLYYQQHGEYPSATAATGGTCTGGTAGTAAVETETAFIEQLTMYTNDQGQACTLRVGGAFPYGPYIKWNDIPANPVTGDSTITIIGAAAPGAGDLAMSADGAGGGWKFDVTSGKLIANDTNTDSKGVAFESY